MQVVEAKQSDLDSFFEYIGVQLVENSDDDFPLFQPISKANSQVTETFKAKFRVGFERHFGEHGWRKLWVVKDMNGQVIAHVDLRHYSEEQKFHRVLLGMGVDRSIRQQGLGKTLIEHAIQFCHESTSIDWLDLNVLSNNFPAKNLYLKCGFKVIGEISDCYRIDQQSVSEMIMTLSTKN